MADITVSYKGNTIAELSASGSKTLQTAGKYCEDDISLTYVQPSGGGGGTTPVPERDVNFIDYDGTIVYSYSASDFLALSALPANPTHTGLTAQGWNWTLANAKTYVTSYGKLWIGQMYVTASGDTEIDVVMQKGRLSPYLVLAVNGTATVDWGDNTASDTVTGTSLTTMLYTPHTYANPGDYTIKVHVVTGAFTFYGTGSTYGILVKSTTVSPEDAVYGNCVQAIRIGSGITTIGNYAFRYSFSLASITIPSSVTSIGSMACYGCYNLKCITIPSDITVIDNYAFYGCYSLASIAIPSGANISGSSAFYNCYSLKRIAIPNGTTSIPNSAFYYCYSLEDITIPSSVTSISGSAFNYCYSLTSITIPSNATSIGGSAFYYCYSLASITIPSSVTSIGNSAFRYCYSLVSITIPSGVTSIGTYVFNNSVGIAEYHFKRTTPPTLSNTNAFSNIPSDCVMYVPYSADHSILNAYKTETNWSTYASYMQEEPQ